MRSSLPVNFSCPAEWVRGAVKVILQRKAKKAVRKRSLVTPVRSDASSLPTLQNCFYFPLRQGPHSPGPSGVRKFPETAKVRARQQSSHWHFAALCRPLALRKMNASYR